MDDDWGLDDEYVPNQWVTLIGAANAIVENAGFSYHAAKRDLLELISDGLLEMRSRDVMEEADIGRINWDSFKGQQCHRNQSDIGFRFRGHEPDNTMPMVSRFWCRQDAWVIDLGRIDWTAGILVGTRPTEMKIGSTNSGGRLITRRAARGLTIRLSSIPFLRTSLSIEGSAPTQLETKLNVGFPDSDQKKYDPSAPRMKKHNLLEIMIRLKSEIENGKISRLGGPCDYGMKSKLEAEILNLWSETDKGGDEPGESTIRRRADELMKIWRQKEGSE